MRPFSEFKVKLQLNLAHNIAVANYSLVSVKLMVVTIWLNIKKSSVTERGKDSRNESAWDLCTCWTVIQIWFQNYGEVKCHLFCTMNKCHPAAADFFILLNQKKKIKHIKKSQFCPSASHDLVQVMILLHSTTGSLLDLCLYRSIILWTKLSLHHPRRS